MLYVCINNIREDKDVFLWLPTGIGKSISYEVMPFVWDVLFEYVIRLKIHVCKPLNYMHVHAVCTRLFFSTLLIQRAWGQSYNSVCMSACMSICFTLSHPNKLRLMKCLSQSLLLRMCTPTTSCHMTIT